MSGLKNDQPLENDEDIPGFEDYDIISGNDIVIQHEGKIKDNEYDEALEIKKHNLLYSSKRPVNLYNEEWNQLYSDDFNIDKLRKKSLDGSLQSSFFRSVCWRCMLGILNNEPSYWLVELKTYRSHYKDLWVELQRNPWNDERKIPFDNPLSQDAESIWHRYFSNEELKSVIHQDVVRTFPGVKFFRNDNIQKLMVRILFCYARQNPTLSYRQGMHEILAPLIFILHCDHQALLQAKKHNISNTDIFHILDPKYIEEDSYTLFKHIMDHIECSYRINNVISTAAGCFSTQVIDDKSEENEVISRLQYIKSSILQVTDPDLIKHLDELDIPLHLFGIRWLRLLFGREFPFEDLLVLWDAIFAIRNFELVNYVVVSMLTAIRPIILASDYTTCLTNLMHYPAGVDIMFIIEYALHLMDSSVYPVPTVTSFSNQPLIMLQKCRTSIKNRAAIENISTSAKNVERLKFVPIRSTTRLSGKFHPLVLPGTGEGDGNVVEGFPLDDPKVLKSDLEYLSTTMVIVHAKLLQYYNKLMDNLSKPLNMEVKIALDGIYELCSILKTYQNHRATLCVEPAFEASEVKQSLSPGKKTDNTVKIKSPSATNMKAHTIPKTRKKILAGELKVFKEYRGGTLIGGPMVDPLRFLKIGVNTNEIDNNKTKIQ